MTDTKQRILEAALDLFSDRGYEAVSVEQLAAKVGIKAPSLYKHFSSKQSILDSLIGTISAQYAQRSRFAVTDEEKREEEYAAIAAMKPEQLSEMILSHIRVITKDPTIAKTRRLLTVEQFRGGVFRQQAEERQFGGIFRYCEGLMRYLIRAGVLVQGDIESMALQFLSPVTVLLQRLDRGTQSEEEAAQSIRRHVLQFYKAYAKGQNGGQENAQN